jgi:predicted Zn-dependent protease
MEKMAISFRIGFLGALILCEVMLRTAGGHAAGPEFERMGHLDDSRMTTVQYTLSDERVLGAIREIGRRVEAGGCQSPVPCVYRVIVNPEINALAMPPCYIYLTTGILDFVEDVDELAAVIAHELSHIRENDGEKGFYQKAFARTVGSATLAGIAAGVGGAAALAIPPLLPGAILLQSLAFGIGHSLGAAAASPLAESIAISIVASYSHDQEYAADIAGARCAATAGYDVRKVIRFWERMEKLPITPSKLSAPNHFLKESPTPLERRHKLIEALR